MSVRACTLALLLALLPAARSFAQGNTTHVSYLAGGSVYVDAGRADGLAPGDTLDVAREGAPIARLLVVVVSNHRASCDTLWTHGGVQLGDDVRWLTPALAAAADSARAAADSARVAALRARAPVARAPVATVAMPMQSRLRGVLGLGWLSVDAGLGARFVQPSLDLRADQNGAAAGHVDYSLDLRTLRTTRSFTGVSDVTDQYARLYRGSFTYHDPLGARSVTFGRQLSPTLAAINLFDGVLLQSAAPTHTLGLFSGTQPDPIRYTFSADILQSGGFYEWHQRPFALRHYAVAVGGVASQERGLDNRDFLFAQSSWFSKGLTGAFTQEVDVNTGWKRGVGEHMLSPTSTFLTGRVPVTTWFAADGGFDNRRNVRLYRDRLTPETQFDDSYRQGAWLGGALTGGAHVRLSGELREGTGADPSHAWSTGAELDRLAPYHLSVRGRLSRFASGTLLSRLASLSASLDPAPGARIDLTAGVRHTLNPLIAVDDRETWESVDLDLALVRRAFLTADWEQDQGTSGPTRQLQAAIRWRF